MKAQLVLGIMSGTSIDGVDYALCKVKSGEVKLKTHWTVDFPSSLRRRLHAAAANRCSSWELAQLHHDLGRFHAEGAERNRASLRAQLVGLHGQTVFHNPKRSAPATLQLGEPAYLVESLRVPVVGNFRAADLAAGGQGAPLATIFHQIVFARRGEHVCVNNLGGISNVTSLDWRDARKARPAVRAFDTGPANVLCDMAMRHFTDGRLAMDRDGAWAAKGQVCAALLADWLRHPFFRRKPPKSTGRELFGEPFFTEVLKQMRTRRLNQFDLLATLTEFSARSLALNYRRHLPPPQRVILTGGGANNRVLVIAIHEELREISPEVGVVTSAELGWPVQAIEPAAFALLAWLRVNRLPGNLPTTTGANRAALCGQVSRP